MEHGGAIMRLVLLGPPGAGKGTQAVRIAEELEIPHFSTGEVLRQNVRDGSQLGKDAKSYIDKGELVPTELITQMLFDGLDSERCKSGWLLDGFPRDLNQAEILGAHLEERSMVLDAVVDIYLADEAIEERLSNRRFCAECGWNCNLVTLPPKQDGVCNLCGGALRQRDDDRLETIRNRLVVYHQLTETLEDYYKRKGILLRIPGDGAPEDVHTRIGEALEKARPAGSR